MLGDCAGIGPEICARVLADRRMVDAARLVVIGDARVLEQGARDAAVSVAFIAYSAPEEIDWTRPEIPVIDLHNLDPRAIRRAEVSAESGRVCGETLGYIIRLALEGRLDGIAFAPLNKAALHAGGWDFHDEHQMFAQLTGHRGAFGREEIEIIAPAVAQAARRGIGCRGPFPADTVFLKAFAGEYDGVLSMYHDQGQIATKLKGFQRGVTVTAGLEIPFATPAHGTAFDIVGRGVASTNALEQAVQLCARLALTHSRS